MATADENKVVIVVANNGDQSARRLIAHQLVAVVDIWQTIRSRNPVVSQVHATRRADSQTLASPYDQAAVRPAIALVVGTYAHINLKERRIAAGRRLVHRRRRIARTIVYGLIVCRLGIGRLLEDWLRVAGLICLVAGSARRIEFDRINVLHVDRDPALASTGAASYQNRKLLVFE